MTIDNREMKKHLRSLYRASFYTEENLKNLCSKYRGFKYPYTKEEKIERGYKDYYSGLYICHLFNKDLVRDIKLNRILSK